MKSTHPITYHYRFDGHDVAVTRRHAGTAYPRNGNVANPTEYFVWDVSVDSKHVMGHCWGRANAYEYGRAHILGIPYSEPNPKDSAPSTRFVNVRPYTVVADEMKVNYIRQEKERPRV